MPTNSKLYIGAMSGIQSFDDKDLIFMNRSHNSQEAFNSIKIAKENGFKNII